MGSRSLFSGPRLGRFLDVRLLQLLLGSRSLLKFLVQLSGRLCPRAHGAKLSEVGNVREDEFVVA